MSSEQKVIKESSHQHGIEAYVKLPSLRHSVWMVIVLCTNEANKLKWKRLFKRCENHRNKKKGKNRKKRIHIYILRMTLTLRYESFEMNHHFITIDTMFFLEKINNVVILSSTWIIYFFKKNINRKFKFYSFLSFLIREHHVFINC